MDGLKNCHIHASDRDSAFIPSFKMLNDRVEKKKAFHKTDNIQIVSCILTSTY